MSKLIRNAARCIRCNTIIESRHRHDFVICPCGSLSVDGGLDYVKRSAPSIDDFEELSEWEDEDNDD